ncbi:MAG: hypothetical protein HKP08_00330 [Flavobacteriaceae bacterium]|nr:hypothetical protein [Flavobacteriaceae bacterium]
MINFFRKTRKKLADDNKFFKYSRYAIGEIVLVVIGILIALQINNWNEDRKTTDTEIEYLMRLRSDLANDTAYYHRRIKAADKIIADHKKAIILSYNEFASPQDFYEGFNNIVWSSEFLTIRDNTYAEMHNAGQINIIKNEKIKTAILEFYRQVDVAAKHFEEFNNTSIGFLSDFLIQSKALKHFWSYGREGSSWTTEMLDESDDWQWINDPKSELFNSFQFTLEFYKNKQNYFKFYCKDLANKSTVLLQEIENELRNRSVEVPSPTIEPIFVID